MLILIYLLLYLNPLNNNQCSSLNQSTNLINHSNSYFDHRFNLLKHSPIYYAKNSNHIANYKNKPFVRSNLNIFPTKFFIISSSILIPGSIYRIVVNLLESSETIALNAVISSTKGLEIANERFELSPQASESIIIKVPERIKAGDYELIIKGDLNSSNSNAGTEINYKALLKCEQSYLKILIETNQLVFNVDQTIKIRILLIDYSMKFYSLPIDVYLFESRGFIVKRWISERPINGLVNLKFKLPKDYPLGWWKIEAHANNQIEKQLILMEKWQKEKFEIFIDLDPFTQLEQESLVFYVHVNYTNKLPVTCNATVRLSVLPALLESKDDRNATVVYGNLIELYDIFISEMKGYQEVRLPLQEYLSKFFSYKSVNSILEVVVEAKELYYGTFVKGFAKSRLESSEIVLLKYLDKTPLIFKQGMPLTAHLQIAHPNHRALSKYLLLSSKIEIRKSYGETSNLPNADLPLKPDIYGVVKIRFIVPANLTYFTLTVFYEDMMNRGNLTVNAVSFKSKNNKYLQIETSTDNAQPNKFAILQIRANFQINHFYYLISVKGTILIHGKQSIKDFTNSVATFPVLVSNEMSPLCKITVYYVTADEEIISDTLILPVLPIDNIKLSLKLNYEKDKCEKQIELIPKMTTNSTICLSAIDDRYQIQAFNFINKARALNIISRQATRENLKRLIYKDDFNKENFIKDYPVFNRYVNSFDAFQMNDLLISSSFKVNADNYCQKLPLNSSLLVYREEAYSNKTITELITVPKNCLKDPEETLSDFDVENQSMLLYLLYRSNRNSDFYESTGHDFTWKTVHTSEFEDTFFVADVPDSYALFSIHAFGLHDKYGLSILDEEVNVDATKSFKMTVECPKTIVIDEQCSINVFLTNNLPEETKAEVILLNSDQYDIIQLDKHQNIKMIKETLQHLINLPPLSSRRVPIPIVAKKIGLIKVKVIAKSKTAQVTKTIEIEVKADGVPVELYLNSLIDLRQKSQLVKHFYINTTERPEEPDYDLAHNYVEGSQKTKICFTGNVVGVIDLDKDLNNLVDYSSLGISLAVETGELFTFNFAYHFLSLHYLQKTDQLNRVQFQRWIKVLVNDYILQLSYFEQACCFKMYKNEQSSNKVWLNSFAIAYYYLADDSDYEAFIQVDQSILKHSIDFLLKNQLANGCFQEENYNPLMFKLFPNSDYKSNSLFINSSIDKMMLLGEENKPSEERRIEKLNPHLMTNKYLKSFKNLTNLKDKNRFVKIKNNFAYRLTPVSLTSHVLISLNRLEVNNNKLRSKLEKSKKIAFNYLAVNLPQLDSPFEIAIATYALLMAKSSTPDIDPQLGVDLLRQQARIKELGQMKMMYWSRIELDDYSLKQRLIMQRFGSESIEASAYALLICVKLNLDYCDMIVNYLNYLRNSFNGFITPFDTIIALHSLIEYSLNTGNRSDTDIQIKFNFNELIYETTLKKENLSKQSCFHFESNIYGSVFLQAKGQGVALMQLKLEYNVDKEQFLVQPPAKAFELEVNFFTGRNHSDLRIRACFSWLLINESFFSDLSILEITLPTGYSQSKQILDEYLKKSKVQNLKFVNIQNRQIVFIFDHIFAKKTCIRFHVEAWNPVARSSKFLKAKIYELNRPEIFAVKIVENYQLSRLDVCKVQGSYQCELSPDYSGSRSKLKSSLNSLTIFYLFKIFLSIIINWKRI